MEEGGLDKYFREGYTDLEYLNTVKPGVMKEIVAKIKSMPEDKNPLKTLENEFKRFEEERQKVYIKAVKWLRKLKARMNKGDAIAKMYLTNYGLIIKRRERKIT